MRTFIRHGFWKDTDHALGSPANPSLDLSMAEFQEAFMQRPRHGISHEAKKRLYYVTWLDFRKITEHKDTQIF